MKKIIVSVLLAVLFSVASFAQFFNNAPIVEVARVENNGFILAEVTAHLEDGKYQFYLNVGALGSGDEVLQIVLNPVSMLYIPLGSSIDEAIASMESILELYANSPESTVEMLGCYAALEPDSSREQVLVTTKKGLFSRKLEFRLQRPDHIEATYLSKSDFRNLLSNVKLNRRIYKDM